MIIGITCSRPLAKYHKFLSKCLNQAIAKINSKEVQNKNLSFITGDAESDIECGKILEDLGYDVVYLAPANKLVHVPYSDKLYMARNINVVNNCTWLISIWDKTSPGTDNTTKYGRAKNKKIIEFAKIPNNSTLSKYCDLK